MNAYPFQDMYMPFGQWAITICFCVNWRKHRKCSNLLMWTCEVVGVLYQLLFSALCHSNYSTATNLVTRSLKYLEVELNNILWYIIDSSTFALYEMEIKSRAMFVTKYNLVWYRHQGLSYKARFSHKWSSDQEEEKKRRDDQMAQCITFCLMW